MREGKIENEKFQGDKGRIEYKNSYHLAGRMDAWMETTCSGLYYTKSFSMSRKSPAHFLLLL